MNKVITSKQEILLGAKKIAAQKGIQGVNIREVAKICNISVGTVYYYFPTKTDLVTDTIEAVWTEIMQDLTFAKNDDFLENVSKLFENIQRSSEQFPDFFTAHMLNIAAVDKTKEKAGMNIFISRLKQNFLIMLEKDGRIRKDAFSEGFSQEKFLDFVFNNIMSLLISNENSCHVLIEIIRRCIY